MNKVLIDSAKFEADLKSIADIIREKNGTTELLEYPQEYADAIKSLVNEEDYIAKVYNREIAELVNNKITSLPPSFYRENQNLTKVDLPNITTLNDTFARCYNLKSIHTPKVTILQGAVFAVTPIEEIYLPLLTTISGNAFYQCELLKRLYFPKLTAISHNTAFQRCSILDTVILGADTVCTLSATTVFDNTPIKKGTGYIYVPSALVEEYKIATNWSVYANQFRAIEDYPEIQAWINELEEAG